VGEREGQDEDSGYAAGQEVELLWVGIEVGEEDGGHRGLVEKKGTNESEE
jgi:hypothetical protein